MRSTGLLKKLSQLLLCSLILVSGSEAWSASFSVVSFNTWGVPFAVKDTWRYGLAMKAIQKINPDFVFLEELFSHKGRKTFQDNNTYPWVVNGPHAFPRLVPGGIRLLSKYPVLSSAKMAYAHCVKSDCLSKKGALLAVIQLPDGQKINLVGTHLNAAGDDSVRVDQLGQLKRFIKNFADPTAPTLISGDFNFGPSSPAYKFAVSNEGLGLRDGWLDSHSPSDLGITYDDGNNHYAHDYAIQTHSEPVTDRIDLNLIWGENLKSTGAQVIFNQEPLLSDHFGLYSTYEQTAVTAPAATATAPSVEAEKLTPQLTSDRPSDEEETQDESAASEEALSNLML